MTEDKIFNKLIPGVIGFGINLIYTSDSTVWNKYLNKKRQMLQEKILEINSVKTSSEKNNRILNSELTRQNRLVCMIKDIDIKIDELKKEPNFEENEEFKDLVNFRKMIEIC